MEWQLEVFDKSIRKKAKFKKLQALLGSTKNKKCLDIGCGTGAISFFLRMKGGDWVSVDLDRSSIIEAKKILQENIVMGNAISLPFKSSSFDCIIGLDIIEHIEDDEKFLFEMCRVLKANGKVYLTTTNNGGFWHFYNKFKDLIGLTLKHYEHVRYGYIITDLKQKLENQGFIVTTTETYSRFFTEIMQLIVNYIQLFINKNTNISPSSKKDINRNKRSFRLYCLIYPLLYTITKLDNIILDTSGYGIIVCAKKSWEEVGISKTK